MAAKSKNHRPTHAGTAEAQKQLTNMADEARKNYEHALRTGQKLQEEAGQWWTRMLGQAMTTADWQKQVSRFTTFTAGAMPLAQRRLEETMRLMETNGRHGAELMKKAVDAAQTASLTECQAKWMDFWSSSIKAVQSNVDAMTELSTHTIDSWLEFVRNNTDTAEFRMPKTV